MKLPRPEWEYKQQAGPKDINVVASVRNMLVQAGLEAEVISAYDTSAEVGYAVGKIPNVQRFHLNKYLNLQLMSGSTSSTNERFCLVQDGTVERWLDLVLYNVIPYMTKERLPRIHDLGVFGAPVNQNGHQS